MAVAIENLSVYRNKVDTGECMGGSSILPLVLCYVPR